MSPLFKITRVLFALTVVYCTPLFATETPPIKRVFITQIVEHPSLNAIRKGVIDALAEAGYKEGKNLTLKYQSAQGQPSIAAAIAKSYAGMSPDLVIAIATPSAQSIVKAFAGRNVPILFSAVTNPVAAGLVKTLDKPGGMVSGTRDFPPIPAQYDLMIKCLPKLQRIGVLYNAAEANSVSILQHLTKEAASRKQGVEIIPSAVSNMTEIRHAIYALKKKKVDAIYLPNDNTVISALPTVVGTAQQLSIPLFTCDPDSVKNGALGSVAYEQRSLGLLTGKMAVRVLAGVKPGDMPIQMPAETSVYFNRETAKKYEIPLERISDDLKKAGNHKVHYF